MKSNCSRWVVIVLMSLLAAAQGAESSRAIAPEMVIAQSVLGNVFLDGEAVTIPVTSRAARVEWRVTDVWGEEVSRGTTPTEGQAALIRPGVTRHGYYLVRTSAQGAERLTSFCVIPPFKSTDGSASPFGVMTHFAQGMDTDILPVLAKAGIASVRDEHYWGHVEKKKGEFVFPERDDAYMAACASNGIAPLIPMTFENKLYDGGLTPYTPEGCDAYGRYGQAILEQYGKQVRWLEIWNEYNGTWCKGPAASNRPAFYAQMLKHAYEKIKAVRPDVKVLGCATVLIPLPYLEGIFTNGGLRYMDGVVLHPYRAQPEGVETEVAEVQALIRKYNDGHDKPIWITETGRWNRDEYEWEAGKKTFEYGRRAVAQYLPRQYALLLSRGVEKIYWYLCRDYQNFVTMGLLRNVNDPMGRYAVAPAYVAYATFIRQLDGARFVRRAELGRFTYALRFQRKDGPVWVCWATQPDHAAFKASQPVRVTDFMGGATTLMPSDGEIALTLCEEVLYLRGEVEPVGAAGHFRIAAAQDTDVLEEPGFAYTLDGGAAGSIEIAGQSYPIAAPGGRIALRGVATGAPGAQPMRYTLALGGKPCAMGTLVLRVVDRVTFDGAPRMAGPGALCFTLANHSARQGYGLTNVVWSVGGQSGTNPVAATLKPGKRLALTIPVPPVPPYASESARIVAECAGRSEVATDAELSYNPCRRGTAKVDGDLSDWAGVEPIDLARTGRFWGNSDAAFSATACIAWDDNNLYIAATLPSPAAVARFAVAPDSVTFSRTARQSQSRLKPELQTTEDPGTSAFWSSAFGLSSVMERIAAPDWTEWVVQSDGAGARVVRTLGPGAPPSRVTAARGLTGGHTVYEIALPWAALAPSKPSDGVIRLALCCDAGGKKPALIEWGRGIAMGKSPDGFRVCRLEKGDGSAPALAGAVAESGELHAAATGSGQPLADSETDYSKQQGQNNWFYGYYAGTGQGHGDGSAPAGPYTDDDFVEMQQIQTMWGYTWGTDAVKYIVLNPTGGHPGVLDGRPLWAVRRWQSDTDGLVRIAGRVGNADKKSDGVGLRVLVDGVQMFETLAGGERHPARQTFDIVVRVRRGSLVDFALTPGVSNNTMYDASSTTFTIHSVGRGEML